MKRNSGGFEVTLGGDAPKLEKGKELSRVPSFMTNPVSTSSSSVPKRKSVPTKKEVKKAPLPSKHTSDESDDHGGKMM